MYAIGEDGGFRNHANVFGGMYFRNGDVVSGLVSVSVYGLKSEGWDCGEGNEVDVVILGRGSVVEVRGEMGI